ncbi:MAG: hypothetical protein GC179_27800 [Anaerolineaceae bacterium]|nr:hypothetical protein [Anaerolineaceae bacterium]
MSPQPVLSRHRLPKGYRCALAALWVTPALILFLSLIVARGISLHLADPRLLLPLIGMALPALYIWREGVDVLPEGLHIRLHRWRYRSFEELDNWYLDNRPQRRLLTIWDQQGRKVLEIHAAHLTNLPTLLATLKDNLRYRNWPY